MTVPPLTPYLHPRFWPLWFGLGLLRTVILLPWPWRLALGRALGRALYQLSGRRRQVAERNIAACFADLDPNQRHQLVRATFAEAGVGVLETAMAWWSSRADFHGRVSLTGGELISAAQARGQGVILVGAHYSTLDLGGILLAPSHPYHATYQRHGNPLLDALIRRGRLRHLPGMVERDDLRQVIKLLKQGQILWLAPDQDVGPERSLFAPFFGVPAATTPIVSRLAAKTGAKVLVFSHQRDPDGHYQLRVRDTLAPLPSGDEQADVAAMNAALEQEIRRAPAQYLWLHRRFKTQPQGPRGAFYD